MIAVAETPQTVNADFGLHIYTDGCYEPRSRTGGWGFAAYRNGRAVGSAHGRVEQSSNNAMELRALLQGAMWLNVHAAGEPSTLWSDSVYAVNGCNQWRPIWKNRGWRKKGPNPNARTRDIPDRELWIAVDAVLSANPHIKVAWCKGHAGNPGNEVADTLAETGRTLPTEAAEGERT